MTNRTAQKKKEAEAIQEPGPQEAEWATAGLLGPDKGYEDTVLPVMGVKVRVRFLDTVETTRLQLLPDYIGFFALVEQLNSETEGLDEDLDPKQIAVDQVAYQAHVAHRAIVDRLHRGVVRCEDCGDSHVRSLWSLSQARRLLPDDLGHITNIALQAVKVASHRPFSKGLPQNGSSEPASSGDSTPPTNS